MITKDELLAAREMLFYEYHKNHKYNRWTVAKGCINGLVYGFFIGCMVVLVVGLWYPWGQIKERTEIFGSILFLGLSFGWMITHESEKEKNYSSYFGSQEKIQNLITLLNFDMAKIQDANHVKSESCSIETVNVVEIYRRSIANKPVSNQPLTGST